MIADSVVSAVVELACVARRPLCAVPRCGRAFVVVDLRQLRLEVDDLRLGRPVCVERRGQRLGLLLSCRRVRGEERRRRSPASDCTTSLADLRSPWNVSVCASSPPVIGTFLRHHSNSFLAPSLAAPTSFWSILPSQSTILSRPLSIGCADLLDDPHELLGDAAEAGELGEEGDHHGQRVGHRLLDPLGGAVDLAGGDRRDRVDERSHDRTDLAWIFSMKKVTVL